MGQTEWIQQIIIPLKKPDGSVFWVKGGIVGKTDGKVWGHLSIAPVGSNWDGHFQVVEMDAKGSNKDAQPEQAAAPETSGEDVPF